MQRECPNCHEIIVYKSKSGLWLANKNQSVCRKCASIKSGFIDRFATKGKNCGKDNPFFGKKHTEENKLADRNRKLGTKLSEETKLKIRIASSGENNPMFGISVYEKWVEKYGVEEADKRLAETKKKHSKNNTGEGNPMYGKPSPNGAGNGWKGWYKNFYFRSLRELCFLIDHPNAISAEFVNIEYINYQGIKRTYRPDFILGNKLIEIKPAKLINSPNNKLKFEAAKKYCEVNQLEFIVMDYDIDIKAIRCNIDNGNIKFSHNYLERFNEYEKVNTIKGLQRSR